MGKDGEYTLLLFLVKFYHLDLLYTSSLSRISPFVRTYWLLYALHHSRNQLAIYYRSFGLASFIHHRIMVGGFAILSMRKLGYTYLSVEISIFVYLLSRCSQPVPVLMSMFFLMFWTIASGWNYSVKGLF